MKLIIDIDDKRIEGINLLAKEQDIATPYPTLEQIISNGIPFDKIRAELTEEKESYEKVGNWKKAYGFEKSIEIIEQYVKGESE